MTAPLALAGSGYDVAGVPGAGFSAFPGFIQIGGKIVYSPITDGWREYLSLMNDWYAKGLINPDPIRWTQTGIRYLRIWLRIIRTDMIQTQRC